MRDITLGDTIYPRFTTRQFSDGVPTTLAGTPVISVYEENNLTQITAGVSVTVDYDGVTGLNQITIVATSGNGYESGKSYDAVITTGTVGGTSVVGEVVFSFTVESAAAAVDLANATDGLGAIKAETALIVADTGELQTNQGNWLTATGFATPTNITAGTITTATNVTNDVGITQAAADKVWSTTTRILTASTNFNDLSAANVNAEVVDVLRTDTLTLPGQVAPTNTPTTTEAISWLYKNFRNKKEQTSSQWSLYDDAGTTVDSKATVADDGTTASKAEIVTGP